MDHNDIIKIRDSAEFQALVKARRQLTLATALTIIIAYFGYISLVAFRPDLLGTVVGEGSVSIGIYIGIALLVLGFALTAIYSKISEGQIAELQKEIQNRFNS